MVHFLALRIGVYFLGWLTAGDIHHPFQWWISEPLLWTASQRAKCLPAHSRHSKTWPGLVWLHHLNFMSRRRMDKVCPLYLPHFPAQQLQAWTSSEIYPELCLFSSIRGSKHGKTTLGAVLCFPEMLQCCSSAGQELFGSSVALEYLITKVGP